MPSPEWKLRTQKVQWFRGETVSVAIGQGQVSATPLQMARVAAAVANGGRLVQPHLVRRIGGEAGRLPASRRPGLQAVHDRRGARGPPGRGGGRARGGGPGSPASRWRARRAPRRSWRRRASREEPDHPRDQAPRLVRLLRPRGEAEDRPRRARGARGQRGRGGGPRGPRDPGRATSACRGAPPRARASPTPRPRWTDDGHRPPPPLQHRLGAAPERASSSPRIGVSTIYSATHSGRSGDLYLKQLYLIGLGMAALLLALLVDYRRLADRALLFYVADRGRPGLRAALRPAYRGHRAAGSSSAASSSSRASSPSSWPRCSWPRSSRSRGWRRLGLRDVLAPGAAVGLLAVLIAARARPRAPRPAWSRSFLAVAFLAGLRMKAVMALLVVGPRGGGLGLAVPCRTTRRSASTRFLDPSLDPQGRRLPEDPVPDRGGLGRASWARARSRAARPSSATSPRATPTSSSPCSPRSWASWAW